MTQQGIINHVAFVLDASDSMRSLASATIKVADNQVSYLAKRSQDLDQETRASVYTFSYASSIKNVFYDKDVLRLPSLKNNYNTSGMTALIDATMKAIEDLEKTATLYGDHAFLLYVLTDGQENASEKYRPDQLKQKLQTLPDNWTIAVLAPSQSAAMGLQHMGFFAGNIAIWDTTQKGIEEVGRKIQAATDNYMTLRGSSAGFRSTRGLFEFDKQDVAHAVQSGQMKALDRNDYAFFPVTQDGAQIRDYAEQVTGKPYRTGSVYYQLSKAEEIQAGKQIAIQDRRNWGAVYSGPEARQVLGLPNYGVRVRAVDHPDFDIYVQSTSYNRKLVGGTNLLVLQ